MQQFAFSNIGKVTVGIIDVDQHPEIGGPLGVRSLPSFVLYKNGEPIRVQAGYREGILETMIEEAGG